MITAHRQGFSELKIPYDTVLAAAFQISPDTSGTTMTVISPATAMERLLMAPSTSPSSSAFEVPMACAEVPSASPFAIGSRIFNT